VVAKKAEFNRRAFSFGCDCKSTRSFSSSNVIRYPSLVHNVFKADVMKVHTSSHVFSSDTGRIFAGGELSCVFVCSC